MQQFFTCTGKLNVRFVCCISCAGWNKIIKSLLYRYVPLLAVCGRCVWWSPAYSSLDSNSSLGFLFFFFGGELVGSQNTWRNLLITWAHCKQSYGGWGHLNVFVVRVFSSSLRNAMKEDYKSEYFAPICTNNDLFFKSVATKICSV